MKRSNYGHLRGRRPSRHRVDCLDGGARRDPGPKPQADKGPQTIDELRAAIARVLKQHHVPGCGFSIVAGDRVIYAGGVGKADLAADRMVDGDTMFRIGSITKGFVALALLQLQEQGKLDLHARVGDLAPDVTIVNPWGRTDPVRLENLLEYTAGFDDFSLAEFYDFSSGPELSLREVFARFPGPQRVRWRPGTFAAYSNPGYGVAGYILERVSGRSCAEYIADNILRPLAMSHSDLRLTPEVKAALAQGYEGNPPWPVPYCRIYLRPAGEMKSSPNEMARFVRMMLNRGTLDAVKIVNPDSITRMETPETGYAAKAGLRYGYALGNAGDPRRAFAGQGHDGGIDGFLSTYEYIPDRRVGLFASINSSASGEALGRIADLLYGYITRDLAPPPKAPAAPLDSTITQAAGFYEYVSPRNSKFAAIDYLLQCGWTYIKSGKLYRDGLIPGSREQIIYVGNGQARTDKFANAMSVYFLAPDGNRYGCGTLACFEQVSPLWPVTRLVLVLGALLTMTTLILFAPVWIFRKISGRMKGVRHLSVRIVPLCAVLVLGCLQWLLLKSGTIVLAQEGWQSIVVCAGSIAFALLSILAAGLAARSFRWEMNRAQRIHSTLVSVACVGITLYLSYWGLIGLRTWAPW